MRCLYESAFIFLLSLMTFGILRRSAYKYHVDSKWAQSLWQFPSHIICTFVGLYFYNHEVKNQFHLLFVPDHDCLSGAYAFFFAFWATNILDYYQGTFADDRDRKVMILHHLATPLALISSDLFGLRRIGLYILLLHDTSDIFIAFMKIAYRRNTSETILTPIYVANLLVWCFTRLYCFGELYLCYVGNIFSHQIGTPLDIHFQCLR